MIYYAGIGSRETPETVKPLIEKLVYLCNSKGFILRSGAAPGADTFFEEYSMPHLREIYLPWRGFNGNDSPLFEVSQEALEFTSRFHPAWNKLGRGARSLMARNSYQVLGQDLKTPCNFIICWTKDGKAIGGTRQAIVIAESLNIPVYNLAKTEDVIKLMHKFEDFSLSEFLSENSPYKLF